MLLWIGLGVLMAGVLAVILRPLLRPASGGETASADGSAIYRDQLTEIAAERQRGLLGASEAEAAHAEVARRLIALDQQSHRRLSSGLSEPVLSRIALGIAAALPILAVGVYLQVGAPFVPDQPATARTAPPAETAKVDELIRAVELRLHQNPEDGQGWDVIGPVYMKQGRFEEAAEAFSNASRILGENTRRLAGFAESTVLANDGIVTPPARTAYEKLTKLEPGRIEPRFWLALAKEQDGKLAAASKDYEALLQDAPADASWRPMVIERLEGIQGKLGLPTGSKVAAAPSARASEPPSANIERGPTGDDVAAAEKLAPDQRQQMIEGMVQGLADRLKKDARDLAGWQRLIRAYSVMGRRTDALSALATARQTFKDEPQSLATLGTLAQSLGLGS